MKTYQELEAEETALARNKSLEKWRERLQKRPNTCVLTFYLPGEIINRIDCLTYSGLILTRSEFYRQAICWKILDVFPMPSFFLYDVERYTGINKMKRCSVKVLENFRKILQSLGPTIDGGYCVFVRMAIIEHLEHYERLVASGGLVSE